MTETHDWGTDMKGFLEWRKTHPLPAIEHGGGRITDRTDEDPMFATTRYERASQAAYNRLGSRDRA